MKKRIIWQKYEDYVNTSLNISKMMMTGQMLKPNIEDDVDEDEFLDGTFDEFDEDEDDDQVLFMRFPVTPDLLNNIKLSTNFDCWVGHANFNLTPTINNKLRNVDGIELLKILTRYRFLVGIGKGFEFKTVRHNIRKELKLDENKETAS